VTATPTAAPVWRQVEAIAPATPAWSRGASRSGRDGELTVVITIIISQQLNCLELVPGLARRWELFEETDNDLTKVRKLST
jgi:hypothetical protein